MVNVVVFYISDEIDMVWFLKSIMCFWFDRIIVGEVCDGVVFILLKVWNIGYFGGFCIIYLNMVKLVF